MIQSLMPRCARRTSLSAKMRPKSCSNLALFVSKLEDRSMREGGARSLQRILERALPEIAALPRLGALIAGDAENTAGSANAGGESRPALESLLASLELAPPGAADLGSVEYHETLALWHLLGRRAGERSSSGAEAVRFVEALLDAIDAVDASELSESAGEESEAKKGSIALSLSARRTIVGAYLEGFVLEREERARLELERSALGSLELRELGEGVALLVLAGSYPHPELGAKLESFGRELFQREARALIVDGGSLNAPRLHLDGIRELVAVAEAIGVYIALVDGRGELGALLGRPSKTTLSAALTEALERSRDGRRFVGALRSRLRGFWRAGQPS